MKSKNGGNFFDNKWVMFGIGGLLGLGGGFAAGAYFTEKKVIKRAQLELERITAKVESDAYADGYDQGVKDFDEHIKKNAIFVDGDNTEEIIANAEKALRAKEEEKEDKNVQNNSENGSQGQILEPEEPEITISDDLRDQIEELYLDGLAVDDIARQVGVYTSVVQSIVKDLHRPTDISSFDQLEDYKFDIAHEDEVREMREETDKYLDEIDRYLGDPTQAPHYISQEDFNNESHLEQVWVNYYAGDNVFVETSDGTQEMEDPTMAFGTSDGNELFSNNPEREDEDIVCIKNFHLNAVYMITRFQQSYASIRDGSAFMDGETGSSRGA